MREVTKIKYDHKKSNLNQSLQIWQRRKKKEKSIPHELVNRNIRDKTEMEREKNVSCLVELSWVHSKPD